jgi:hypothetical protein
MQPAIDTDTLERLLALGRARGFLTNRDLEEALPTDRMSAEDIALIVGHLEDAGIPVDLEDDLNKPHPGAQSQDLDGAQILPFPDRPSGFGTGSSTPEPAQVSVSRPSDAPMTKTPGLRAVHWEVLGSLSILGLTGFLLLILSN